MELCDLGDMEDASMKKELLGLDPPFLAYMKMYISDLCSLKENSQLPGTFWYGGHLVQKVDIVGVVVKKTEREKLYSYAVDDGTGVINCCCWKNTNSSYCVDTTEPASSIGLPDILLQKLDEVRVMRDAEQGYNLGDLVHIRGNIKVFNSCKEISAHYHAKLTDPVMEVYRMLQLPKIYKDVYDKDPQIPESIKETMGESGSKIKMYTQQLYQRILGWIKALTLEPKLDQSLLQKLFPDIKLSDAELSECYHAVTNLLCAEGHLYKNGEDTREMSFNVTLKDSSLKKSILKILSQECLKSKYQEIGCHVLHILDLLHKTFQFKYVTQPALLVCLDSMEASSDVISTTRKHYIAYL